ncbi:glycosyltransferase involved in cell wall biosynthesis [Methanocalculus alkaliphilus]|nr:glycosyltransferase involved in cell wall biosynthesis [Methanocalculus alkaliphilus]
MKEIEPSKQDGFHIIWFTSTLKVLGNSISLDLPLILFRIRDEFDIIHAHSHLFFSTNLCALFRKFNTTPLVITNHGLISASAPEWFNVLYLKTIGKWTLNAADAIICYTEDEKKRLIEYLHLDETRVTVISNGVNTDLFHPRNYDHLTDQKGIIHLLWVGRFVKGKGVEFIIQAMDTLVKEYPDLMLTLVGEGPEKRSIQNQIAGLGLENAIKIIDFIRNDEMPVVYQHSDIFLLPSLHEGVPRTVLEAMSCGLPVVISEFTHLRDLLDGGGIMFPKKNVPALANCLRILINNEDQRKIMGNLARERIVRELSWDETVRRTLDLYQKILLKPKERR